MGGYQSYHQDDGYICFYKVSDKIQDTSCCICFHEYENGSMIFISPCNHVFHYHCISQWFKKERTCPLCRKSIP